MSTRQPTTEYIQSVNEFFQANIKVLKKIIKQVVKNKTMHTMPVFDYWQDQVICHLIKIGQTDDGKVRPYKNHPWMQQHILQQASQADKIMLNYFISRDLQERNEVQALYHACYHALKKNVSNY